MLLAAALSALVLLCTLGGTSYAWGSPTIIGLGVLTVVLLVAFVFVEQRAAEPVLPIRAVSATGVFSVTSAMGLVVGFALFGSVTYLPLFLQVVNGATPDRLGAADPAADGRPADHLDRSRASSSAAPAPTSRFRSSAPAVMVAGAVPALDDGRSHRAAWPHRRSCSCSGSGSGSVMQVLVLAVQNAVDYKDLGVATSGATLFRSIGGSVGTAILGSIFCNRLSAELASSLPPSAPHVARRRQRAAGQPGRAGPGSRRRSTTSTSTRSPTR